MGKSREQRKEIMLEANILEALDHPYILSYRECYENKMEMLCIVTEYCEKGTLEDEIQRRKGDWYKGIAPQYFDNMEVLTLFTHILLAVKHLHNRKIIHRDLKAENIFVMENGELKVGDFGTSLQLNPTDKQCMTVIGQKQYISPEIFDH